ncbi:type II secretion system secretin GspD [Xanthomonas graminis]|jgi:general secretion pathway protein D|uniref:General secretion pathway protein D n=1 Tax=Xanthomonas graminis pv. graminis TaxID=134874 RepID=A0A1M4IBL9_9XANT|nr:type II secretion system secretin GspD [Xanthomonas translucens]EKU26489.1 Type II secretory pathway component [Xanthomonas translucens pv. graminis ART-Xtg29]OAX60512.1 type II secretion system protein GspD [Xanthomonas translucens pv. graminis]UKE53932.1 type II secretion system secretin GspD [Xanthomonas translucens pv. graminis]WIH09438.1 type II secretion system secretin GspD [Xanthomonas translucens pv. graminis]WIH12999.1 type II secretion system secretin GspD [Xanthomonas translucen
MTPRLFSLFLAIGLVAGCATTPSPDVRRGAAINPNVGAAGSTSGGSSGTAGGPAGAADPNDIPDRVAPVIRRGSGTMINSSAAAAPAPSLANASSGSATFNFEGESVHAVVKAILGDMLGQNYVIAPGVQGTVTLATPKPVSPAQALNLLEMVLGWNNARMVYSGGRYNIVPADQALAGTVAPSTASPASARGFEVRVVPLKFISASEMKKVLEPYARPNAIVGIDGSRNVITLGGTRAELENYLRTVQIFDVDWLSGMSVGVFPIQSGKAEQVAADLEKVFGDNSKTPSAGMFRFMPLENANAVLVITPQARYLDQIHDWLDRIDSAGGGSRLFSYELKYIKAKDLADRLAEVFGAGGNRGDSNASLMPGTQLSQMGGGGLTGGLNGSSDGGLGGSGGLNGSSDSLSSGSGGSSSGSSGGLGSGSLQLSPRTAGNGSVTLDVQGDKVGVSAVEETNTLLVRSTPQSWRSIRDVVEKLDVMPMQVHIEAQVAEVSLTGQLQYGVNWFFENSVNASADGNVANSTGLGAGGGLPSAAGRNIWGDIAGKIGVGGLGWTFLGKNAAAVISALDKVTNLKLLQTPSVFVRNNAEATLNVGTRIPINSTSINTGIGADSTYSSVQYIDTGVILKVRPRVTKDGMVFLDIVQEVSTPGARPAACTSGTSTVANSASCNVDINTRRVKTEAAVQSGDTIMLAGLINDSTTDGSAGVPLLSKLPVVGALFGQKTQDKTRNEVIVLLTPTIVRNPQEARNLTDEYGQKFKSMQPLPASGKK